MLSLAVALALSCAAPRVQHTAFHPMAPVLRNPATCQAPRFEVGPFVVPKRNGVRT